MLPRLQRGACQLWRVYILLISTTYHLFSFRLYKLFFRATDNTLFIVKYLNHLYTSLCIKYKGNMFLTFPINSKANASEYFENMNKTFVFYLMVITIGCIQYNYKVDVLFHGIMPSLFLYVLLLCFIWIYWNLDTFGTTIFATYIQPFVMDCYQ